MFELRLSCTCHIAEFVDQLAVGFEEGAWLWIFGGTGIVRKEEFVDRCVV
jgi:hypothetical protein